MRGNGREVELILYEDGKSAVLKVVAVHLDMSIGQEQFSQRGIGSGSLRHD